MYNLYNLKNSTRESDIIKFIIQFIVHVHINVSQAFDVNNP